MSGSLKQLARSITADCAVYLSAVPGAAHIPGGCSEVAGAGAGLDPQAGPAPESGSVLFDALAFFDDWLALRLCPNPSPRQQLSREAATPYRYIWSSWVQWLTQAQPLNDGTSKPARASCWTHAQPSDVLAFLDEGVLPAACARRGPGASISSVTRRRYWRVLDLLYAHALVRGRVSRNPVSTPESEPPPPEVSEGLVLLGARWEAVRRALPEASDRWALRDRVLMLLLMDCGLRLEELLALKVGDVGESHRPMTLQVRGGRRAQSRCLTLDESLGPELRAWLQERRSLVLNPKTEPDLLFVSLQGCAMSSRSVFLIVSEVVGRGLKLASFELAQHLGPQVLRNSCIVRWVHDGLDPTEVCRRAGFSDPRSFRGLKRHLPANITSIARGGQRAGHGGAGGVAAGRRKESIETAAAEQVGQGG